MKEVYPNNNRTLEIIKKFPIVSIEIREHKTIEKTTIIKNSDNSQYIFDDVVTNDYNVYFEIWDGKTYITHQFDCKCLEDALTMYNEYIRKVCKKG